MAVDRSQLGSVAIIVIEILKVGIMSEGIVASVFTDSGV